MGLIDRVTNYKSGDEEVSNRLKVATSLGQVFISCSPIGLTRVGFMHTQLDQTAEFPTTPILAKAAEQLLEYLNGDRKYFDLPIDWHGINIFQLQVLQLAGRIPYGELKTYGQLADSLDKPSASRAVGMALAKNPFLIVIPCHRVVGTNRSLTGYAGGLAAKKALLELEGHRIVAQKLV